MKRSPKTERAEDAKQVIFNPLVQIEKTTMEPHERPSSSLGLGLYIAREVVMRHGGTIGVTSTAQEGTAFTVYLPQVLSATEFSTSAAGLSEQEKEFDLLSGPFTTFANVQGRTWHPAFQLESKT